MFSVRVYFAPEAACGQPGSGSGQNPARVLLPVVFWLLASAVARSLGQLAVENFPVVCACRVADLRTTVNKLGCFKQAVVPFVHFKHGIFEYDRRCGRTGL